MSVKSMQMAKMPTINLVMIPVGSVHLGRQVQAHNEYECTFLPQSLSSLNMLLQYGGRKKFQLQIFVYLKHKNNPYNNELANLPRKV